MSRSTKRSTFVICSLLLLLLGQTSALLSVQQRSSVSHASQASPLYLCPGEGKKLVDAFNEAVAEANLEDDLIMNTTPTTGEVLQQVNGAAAAAPAAGIVHRIRHALVTIATAPLQQRH